MENIIAESCENSKFPFLSRLISFLLQKAEQTKHNVFLIDFLEKRRKTNITTAMERWKYPFYKVTLLQLYYLSHFTHSLTHLYTFHKYFTLSI